MDRSNSRIRFVSASTGIISTIAGTGNGYFGDGGLATAAKISYGATLAFNPYNGIVYIADRYNYRIRVISASTKIISTIAGTGTSGFYGDTGHAFFSSINEVVDIAINPVTGDVYLADEINKRIRKLSFNNCSVGYYGVSCANFNCTTLNSCNSHGICVSPQNCFCSTEWNSHADCSENSAGVKASKNHSTPIHNGKTNQYYTFY